ncbi:MAG TPA: hypothetical protein VM075_04790 [Anaerolineae bacterium]|nr:hypothetical protein [Anaerolineae bacterium]
MMVKALTDSGYHPSLEPFVAPSADRMLRPEPAGQRVGAAQIRAESVVGLGTKFTVTLPPYTAASP